MKRTFGLALIGFALLCSTAALAQQTPPPATPITPGAAAFYIVQGTVILSAPYANGADCLKALAKIKKDIAPGKDTLACAHRRP